MYGYPNTLRQLVGLDQLVGVDAAIVPAVLGMVPVPAQNRGISMAVSPPPAMPGMVPQASRGPRQFAVGFGPTPVNGNTTLTQQRRPELIFRPDRLVVPATVGPNFSIQDLKVGKNSQFVDPNPVPAEAFAENAVNVAMSLDTCNVGQSVTIVALNTTANQATFKAILFGLSIDG